MLQFVRPLVLVVSCFAVTGCGGQLGRAVEGVQELQPEAEQRNREIEEMAGPPGAQGRSS